MRIFLAVAAGIFCATSAAKAATTLSENFDEPGGFFGGGLHNQDSFPPGDWQVINHSDGVNGNNSSWYNGPQSIHEVFPAQSGSSFAEVDAASGSGDATLSNWLLTPMLSFNAGDQISFYARTSSTPVFADRLQLRISTAGSSANVGSSSTDVGDFSNLLVDINPNYKLSGGGSFPSSWTQFTATVPTAGSGRLAFRYFVEDGGPSGDNSDFIGLDSISVTSNAVIPPGQWISSSGGSWSTAGNWSNSAIPNAPAAHVSFLATPGLSAPGTLTVDGASPITVGQITFNSANSYSIAPGTTTLTIDDTGDAGGIDPAIIVNSGFHSITSSFNLANGARVNCAAGTGLTIGGKVGGTGTLTVAGAGIVSIGLSANFSVPLQVDGNLSYIPNTTTGIWFRNQSPLTISSTGQVKLLDPTTPNHANRQTLVISSLTLAGSTGAWQGKLDMGGNDMIVHGGNAATIADQIKQAFNGGLWNGTAGITSSMAAAGASPKTALGYELNNNGSGATLISTFDGATVNNTDVLVKYTLVGDANLDGSVNFSDLLVVAQHYNGTATAWNSGDFNYDGTTNFNDLLGLAQNYAKLLTLSAAQISTLDSTGGSAFGSAFAQAQAQVAVPEPGFLTLSCVGLSLLRRRRRRSDRL